VYPPLSPPTKKTPISKNNISPDTSQMTPPLFITKTNLLNGDSLPKTKGSLGSLFQFEKAIKILIKL
jgi:hypothetical protein